MQVSLAPSLRQISIEWIWKGGNRVRKLAKYLFVFLFIMIVVMGKDVYAEEPYYTNSKGVSFTKEQYDFYMLANDLLEN